MSRPGPSRFACRCRATRRALRPHCLTCRGRARGGGAPRGGALCMTRKSRARRRAAWFVLENPRDGARNTRAAMGLALVLARLIGVLGAPARACLDLAFGWGAQGNACAPSLGE